MAIGTHCEERNKQDSVLRQIYKAPVIPFPWDHHPGARKLLQDLIKSPDRPTQEAKELFSAAPPWERRNQSLADSAAEGRSAPTPHSQLQEGPAVGSRDKAGQEGGRALLSHPVCVAFVPPQAL